MCTNDYKSYDYSGSWTVPIQYPSYTTYYSYPVISYREIDWDKLEGMLRRVVREELEKRG